MQARETNLLKFLQGTRQFIIPIYQRTYSWTQLQCQQLWNDILRAGQDDDVSGHFIGSVVYVERGLYTISSVPQVLVIDGQQRLTTLTLLLAALGKVLDERGLTGDTSRKKIENYYLFNPEEDGELRYKLLLTRGDKDTLIQILDATPAQDHASKHVTDNYSYFLSQLQRADIDPFTMFRGISKLIIVDIALDRNNDNPQLIFESLNSTGLELSQADLIRNYILMGLDVPEQTRLYNTYWFTMEQRLSKADYVPMFDRFIRDFLTVKSRSGAIPNIAEVYTSFKTYRVQQATTPIADIVADIYRFAQHFIKLAFAEDPDKAIASTLADINALKVDVAYPFLLEVCDDYSSGLMSRADFLAILQLVESYVFRRSVCGIPTNSMNKTFATFSREIDKEHYRESVEAVLLAKDSYRRFPRDPEFVSAFVVKDFYNFRNRNYVLRKLENEGRKEPITIEEYTIEHIMPQNEVLSPAWRSDLGPNWQEVHSTYLHTIGNLTLTGYNSELSDHSFVDKRRMEGGFDESPLRLNASIAHLDSWNREQIVRRAQLLAEKAAHIWAAPTLPAEIIARYAKLSQVGSRSYELHETAYGANLQGAVLELFEQLRKRILNLDSSVREEFKAYYVAYKTTTNFVDVQPQKQRLRLTLNMRFDEIVDPLEACKDVTGLGRWGNGDVEVSLDSLSDVDNVMFLVEQAFEKHAENAA